MRKRLRRCLEWTLVRVGLLCVTGMVAWCQPAPWRPAPLRPGEGLAISLDGGPVQTFGEARAEAPMGGLAQLVWLKLEGIEWSSRDVRFTCSGTLGPYRCPAPRGHGKLTLRKAFLEDCDLAFLFWAADSMARWKQEYGEAPARLRMDEVFAPFLGTRMPVGQALPEPTPAWVGHGDLLRTSPAAMVAWLMDPERSEVVDYCHRYLSGFFSDLGDLVGKERWWFKSTLAEMPGPCGASAWVAAGRGATLAVMHLPGTTSRDEAKARFQTVMGIR